MKAFQFLFTGIGLLGVSIVARDYYLKNYYIECPANHKIIIKNYFNNIKSTDQYYYPIPKYQQTQLYKTKQKLSINGVYSTLDKQILIMALKADIQCVDIIKAYHSLGAKLQKQMIEMLGQELSYLCSQVNSKGQRLSDIKKKLKKDLKDFIVKAESLNGIKYNIDIEKLKLQEKINYRIYPESLL